VLDTDRWSKDTVLEPPSELAVRGRLPVLMCTLSYVIMLKPMSVNLINHERTSAPSRMFILFERLLDVLEF
jgi:hypothetical protein